MMEHSTILRNKNINKVVIGLELNCWTWPWLFLIPWSFFPPCAYAGFPDVSLLLAAPPGGAVFGGDSDRQDCDAHLFAHQRLHSRCQLAPHLLQLLRFPGECGCFGYECVRAGFRCCKSIFSKDTVYKDITVKLSTSQFQRTCPDSNFTTNKAKMWFE